VTVQTIYVLGTGRSGSTLLDAVLGTHDELTSLGEVMGLPHAFRFDLPSGDNATVRSSPFWSQFTGFFDTVSPEQDAVFAGYGRLPLVRRRHAGDFRSLNSEFYRLLENALPHGSAVVDSSKVYWRLDGLIDSNIGARIAPVILLRDGRAVVSAERKQGRSRSRGIGKWIAHNVGALRMLRRHRRQALLVSYEHLCRHPLEVLAQTLTFAGRSLPGGHQLTWNGHRTVGGSLRVHDLLKSEDFGMEPSMSWRDTWTREDERAFRAVASPLDKLARDWCEQGIGLIEWPRTSLRPVLKAI
jgi:hypothetical protein